MENMKVEVTFTVGELNLLLKALAELPFKESYALISKVKQAGDKKIDEEKAKGEPVSDRPVVPKSKTAKV